MKRLAACLLLLSLAAFTGVPVAASGADRVELEVPETIRGVRLADVDGDGITDLVVLESRRVHVYPGAPDALPQPKARYVVDLPQDVSYVDALPASDAGPALLAVGTDGIRRIDLRSGAASALPGREERLTWADGRQANLANLARPDGSILLPTPDGWRRVLASGVAVDLPVEPFLEVEPAGDFIERSTVVTHALPQVFLGTVAGRTSTWALGGRRLVGVFGEHVVEYDTSFLPKRGNVTLVDLTGDGVPEVVHADGTNQERTIAIFRTPEPTFDAEGRPTPGGDLRPPAAVLRLTGYCLDPDYVDLDGDGYLDVAVTTIPIDARNTTRALGGNVSAGTRAFLNRTGRPASGRLFPGAPDASVVSDIGVQIRFNPAGNIDIRRSLTILVDGDTNADGRKDLVIRTADDALTIRPGTARGVWAKDGHEVSIPAVGDSPNVEGWTADLTGDGKAEILLLYRKPWQGRDRLHVLRP